MSTITKDLGLVTAYGYAKSKGYNGTEEEFAELMASYATVAEQAAQSASTASEKAQQAAQAVLDAVAAKEAAVQAKNDAATAKTSAQDFATSASQSAQSASGSASSASQSASAASSSADSAFASAQSASQSAEAANTAKTDAQTAKTDAETAQGKAEEAQALAEEAAEELSAEVAQIETNKNDIAELKNSVADVIANTASGDVASFADGANDYPVKDLVAHIEPVQDLHGYANPWPAGGGKNKLKITATSTTINGITYTVNEDGTVVANGTASDSSTLVIASGRWLPDLDGDLILNGSVGGYGNSIKTRFGVSNPDATYDDFGNGVTIPQISNLSTKYAYAQITISSGTTVNNIVFKPMLRLATETDATFAPYSNICPITGWTGANVTRTGKNWFPLPVSPITRSGITIEATADGKTRIYGTPTVSSSYISFVLGYSLRTLNGKTCTISMSKKIEGIGVLSGSAAGGTTNIAMAESITSKTGAYAYGQGTPIAINVRYDVGTIDEVFDIQLEVGSTATAYEPYQGDTYAVTFPTEAGTVYGGTLDVTTGVLTVDKANIASYNGETLTGEWISDRDVYSVGSNPSIGAQVVYELATPVTYQCTPEEVKTLLGMNNVYADTGAVDVEYCADTKKYIDNAIATAIAAL